MAILNNKHFSRIFSDENLTKKASMNAFASAIDYGARLIVGFLVQPIMVSGLGDFYYGVWQVLLRLMGYITPASGRSTQTLKMTLANKQNTANEVEKRRYIGSTLVVWAMFLPIMSILGGLLTWYIPFWIKSPVEYYQTIRLTSAILVSNLILTNLAAIPQSVLEGENLGYKRMGLSAILVILGGGLTWLAVWLKTGIIGVALASLAVTLLSGAFYMWVVHDYAPWFGIAWPSFGVVKEFLSLSWWFLAWNLIMNLMTASDVLILGILLSVENVTDYSLSKYAPETLISIVAIMAFGIAPGLGGIIGSGKLEKAAHIRGEIMVLTWLIMTTLGSVTLLWNRTFISLWVGAEHFVGVIPNLLIILTIMQFVLIRNDGNIIDISLRLRSKVLIGAISVFLSLAIAIVLISYFKLKIMGLCLGLITGRSILSINYPLIVGRLLRIPLLSQLKSSLRPIIITILLFTFAIALDNYLLNSNFTVNCWIILGFGVGISFLISLGLAIFVGLSHDQRTNLINRVKIVINMGPN